MSPAITRGLAVIWLLLAFAAGCARWTARRRPSPEKARVLLRIKTWGGIILVFTSLFVFPPWWSAAVFLAVGGTAAGEIYRHIWRRQNGASAACAAWAAVAGSLICWQAAFFLPGGKEAFFFSVSLCQFNDITQYLWGKGLGKTPIAPKVSPGKTWGGFIGGVCSSAAAAFWVAPYYTPLSGWQAALAGAVLAALGLAGDLSVSVLKRKAGIKDMGTCLPGHGGILDRIDSLLFAVPLFLLVTLCF